MQSDKIRKTLRKWSTALINTNYDAIKIVEMQ